MSGPPPPDEVLPDLFDMIARLHAGGVHVAWPMAQLADGPPRVGSLAFLRAERDPAAPAAHHVLWLPATRLSTPEGRAWLADLIVRTYADLRQYGPDLDRWQPTADGLGWYVWITEPATPR